MFSFVSTCTFRKTVKPDPACLMGMVEGADLSTRFRNWTHNIESCRAPLCRPLSLYSGGSWSAVRRIIEASSGIRPWVVSAGHGLISVDQPVCSYGATFAAGEADSILAGKSDSNSLREWWRLLCEWRKKLGAEISSITEIALRYPNEPIVAALSADYLKATLDDLVQARCALADPDLLILISAGTKPKGPLANNLVPADARFEHLFGKSRLVLNNKIAALVLREFKPEQMRARQVSEHLEKMICELPPSSYPTRTRGTDADVRRFLESKLSTIAHPSYTALLKEYRALGRACEQRRFRALFRETSSAQLSNAA